MNYVSGSGIMTCAQINSPQAFILTMGTTHYRTEDQGRTWISFKMPARPALVAHPLSFHSDPTKYGYILYQATVCERVDWAVVCHDEVCKKSESRRVDLIFRIDILYQGSILRYTYASSIRNHSLPVRSQY